MDFDKLALANKKEKWKDYYQGLMTRGAQDIRNCVMYGQNMCADRSQSKFSLTPHNWVKQRVAVQSIYTEQSQFLEIPGIWKHTGKKSGKMFWNIWGFFLQMRIFTQLKILQNLCKKFHLEKKTLVLMYLLTNIHTSYTEVSPAAIM